jgi:hypothetical protein
VAFAVGLAARAGLDSRPAGAIAFVVVLVLAIAAIARWGTAGLRPDVRAGRLAIWTALALLVALVVGVALPTLPGAILAALVVALPLYLWSLALEPPMRTSRP